MAMAPTRKDVKALLRDYFKPGSTVSRKDVVRTIADHYGGDPSARPRRKDVVHLLKDYYSPKPTVTRGQLVKVIDKYRGRNVGRRVSAKLQAVKATAPRRRRRSVLNTGMVMRPRPRRMPVPPSTSEPVKSPERMMSTPAQFTPPPTPVRRPKRQTFRRRSGKFW